MTQAVLPDDILHLLCEELANQEQFDTLFNCACASRALAIPALTHLYKYFIPAWLSGLLPLLILMKIPPPRASPGWRGRSVWFTRSY